MKKVFDGLISRLVMSECYISLCYFSPFLSTHTKDLDLWASHLVGDHPSWEVLQLHSGKMAVVSGPV